MFKLVVLLSFFFTVYCNKSNDYYTVLIPGKLRPNSVHLVTVSINALATNVSFTLTKRKSNDTENLFEKKVEIAANSTQVVPLNVGNLDKSAEYKIIVNGSGGINFTDHTDLNLDALNKLAFIQTDKAIYKAGQKVNFRVFIVDQELRPLGNVSTKVIIKDSKENIVFSMKNTTLKNGLVQGDIQLSPQPLLGNWIISVEGDVTADKSFTVDEYVPPNFGVDIKVPRLITKSTQKFFITVESKYTYGKPVKGELTLKVMEAHYSYYRYGSQDNERRVEYLTDINGISHVEVETKDFLDASNFYDSKEYSVIASVRDYLTDKVYNKTLKFKMYNDKYKFKFLDSNNQFVPGIDLSLKIKVTYPNDDPIDFDETVKVIYGFGYQEGKKREVVANAKNAIFKVNLNTKPFDPEPSVITSKVNGTRKTLYLPQKDESSTIKVDVLFKGEKYLVGYIYKSSKSTDCYMNLRLEDGDQKFKIGDQVKLVIDSLNPIKQFVYHVTNKRGTSKSEVVSGSNKLNIDLTEDSSPKTRILVHFDCNGTLITDGVDIKVDGIVKNTVSMSIDKNVTTPGNPINIDIEAEANSKVAILGVDKKIYLLKTGNDISKEDLIEGTEKYVGCNGNSDFESCSSTGGYYWYHQPTPWEIRKSGLILLSNKYNLRIEPTPVNIVAFSTTTGLRGGIGVGTTVQMARPQSAPVPISSDSFESQPFKKSQSIAEKVQIRKEFPETFIWDIVDTNESGRALYTKNVPDSITSYQITSIGIGSKLGLSEGVEFSVFIPFFVSPSLPYSIIREEVVAIEVQVFNYLDKPQTTDVTLFNENDEFEFINGSSSSSSDGKDATTKKSKQITVDANSGATLNFLIKPKKVGNILIDILATGENSGDRINKQLLVKPEGQVVYQSSPFLINANKTNFKRSVALEMPNNIVPDSEYITVNVVGDLLGPQINSIQSLIRIPYGCGEQNMVNFVPNIVILDYLTKLNRLTPSIEEKLKSYMLLGYQRELTYKLDDGSYSAFGISDKHGSTFLTAFVTKSFDQAKKYIDIDKNVISKGYDFLRSKQNNDGSFREDGRVFSSSLKSGIGGDTGALSAYVLIALANGFDFSSRDEMLNKTEAYLIRRLAVSDNKYETVIITYALHVIDSKEKDNAFEKLNKIKVVDNEFWKWSQNKSGNEESTIEMTSYALMVYVLRGKTEEALPILRYLISKQNSKGGYRSTQDTVIGIEALAKFASEFSFAQGDLNLKIETDLNQSFDLKVSNDNAFVLQQVILDKKTRNIVVTSTGSGSAFVGVGYQYNLLKGEKKPSFALRHEYSETNNAVNVNVCTKYLEGNESGMAIIEANLPSGVTADLESFDDMKKSLVKRVETKDSDTVIVAYFDKITNEEICIQFIGNKVNKVANSKQVPVVVYDYYDTSKRITSFYQPTQHSTCEICEGSDCDQSCQP